MKTIEIDEEVYAFLQENAISFVENNPNQVIGRLLGITKKSTKNKAIENPNFSRPSREKKSRVNLNILVEEGYLQEGQHLFLNYKDKVFLTKYEAVIHRGKLLYEGKQYSMSGLVDAILEKEGAGILSRAYRGPEYWCTGQGDSIRNMWAQYLKKEGADA